MCTTLSTGHLGLTYRAACFSPRRSMPVAWSRWGPLSR